MTPEREAQMRAAFEREFAHMPLRRGELKPDSYWCPTTACAWEAWKTCARALEPLVRDGERFKWLQERFIGYDFDWNPSSEDARDGKSCAVFEIGRQFRGTADIGESIDAAMSAALEDGNADV